MADLLPSLSSDEEDAGNVNEEDDDEEEDVEMDTSFQFGGILGEDGGLASSNNTITPGAVGWSYKKTLETLKTSTVPRMDVDALIAAKRKSLRKRNGDEKDTDEEDDSVDEQEQIGIVDDDASEAMDADVLKTKVGKNEQDDEEEAEAENEDSEEGEEIDNEQEEAAKQADFFDEQIVDSEEIDVFAQLTLSRPLLRGVAAMGFVKPTPIQAAVIPKLLQGRDVCASAVTGSGKSAAFLLPICERMLHRASGTKALVLTPTRELAAQCASMMSVFAEFTKLTCTLIVGGAKNVQAQAAELRTRPDLIVATPGRLLDHVTNTSSFNLDCVEFLCLDEADRLLDLGFTDEVREIIKACPVSRQTMLFSATLTTKVDELIKLSLKNPVRIRIGDEQKTNITVAPRLEQEFVRIRASNEGVNREAVLLALLTRTFQDQVIVFFDTKVTAHRLMIVCGLCGIKCAELHGNLTQQQRLTALEDFRNRKVDVLLATDLAARGLDIDKVRTVINFEMPSQIETYVHRIGRTARAGRGGCSCTLIGEGRRHLMKTILKDSTDNVVRSRTVPAKVIDFFANKITSLENAVREVMEAEAVARLDRLAEMEAIKAQNLIEHADEIQQRAQRGWFASNKQKQQVKEAAVAATGTGTHRMSRKKRRARDAMKAFEAGGDSAEDHDDDNDQTRLSRVNVKSEARQQKRRKAEMEREFMFNSIYDEAPKAKKIAKAADASGDSNLFREEKVVHSARKENKESTVAKSPYRFRGFDPDMRLGKKKGHSKFKSKSKYKRR